MAQYDLILTQNVHATLVEYSEKFVNLAKGSLLSAVADQTPTVLAGGTDGYMLVRDDVEVTGLKWVVIAAGHTQNTDVGTTSLIFELDSDGFQIELTAESAAKFGIKVNGGATYADIEAKDATFAKVTVVAAPSAGTDLTNKTYVDGILASNDAMTYKGTIGTAGTYTISAFNLLVAWDAGDTYKVIEAGTIRGNVCEIGDMLIAIVDRASGGVDADWTVVQANIDGAVIGPASAVDNGVALFDGVTGVLIKDGGVLGTGAFATIADYVTKATWTANSIVYATTSATPVALTVGASTFVGRIATGNIIAMTPAQAKVILAIAVADISDISTTYVAQATFNAQTILAAVTDNTPVAVTVAAQTLVGRITAGNIAALTAAQVMGILWQTAPAAFDSAGTLGHMAYDDDYFYVCTVGGIATVARWNRTPLALNWV